MSRTRTDARGLATACVAFACVAWLLVFAGSARAGAPPSSDSTTTTEEPTTTTTEAVTTTSVSTTTQPRPSSSTTSAVPRSTPSSTAISTTTSEPPPSSTVEEQAPEIVSDDTLPSRTSSTDDGGLSTDTKLALVVGGLVGVGLLIGLLTFLYWRHTRPQRYMDALDALADVEQKVPRGADDVPTAEHAVIPAGVAAGTAGATTAVRILESDPPTSMVDSTQHKGASDTPKVVTETGPDAPADEPVSLDEPTTITTVEDLRTNGEIDKD